jgi:hypothetical protein
MAIDFAEVLLLEQPGPSDPALHHLPIASPRDVRRAARHPLCGLSITLVVARHLYGEGGSFGRCKVRISPRQCFVCVEAVLGEVSEWIVGDSLTA